MCDKGSLFGGEKFLANTEGSVVDANVFVSATFDFRVSNEPCLHATRPGSRWRRAGEGSWNETPAGSPRGSSGVDGPSPRTQRESEEVGKDSKSGRASLDKVWSRRTLVVRWESLQQESVGGVYLRRGQVP